MLSSAGWSHRGICQLSAHQLSRKRLSRTLLFAILTQRPVNLVKRYPSSRSSCSLRQESVCCSSMRGMSRCDFLDCQAPAFFRLFNTQILPSHDNFIEARQENLSEPDFRDMYTSAFSLPEDTRGQRRVCNSNTEPGM